MSLLRIKELEAQLARRNERINSLECQLAACEAQNKLLQELIANHAECKQDWSKVQSYARSPEHSEQEEGMTIAGGKEVTKQLGQLIHEGYARRRIL